MNLPANYLMVEQRSAEWFQARCGCVTSSRVDDAVRKLKKGGVSATRESYKMELLTEVLTGRSAYHYVSSEMYFGIENEPLARAAYEISRETEIQQVGFVFHPHIKQAGASPDGLIGEDGLIEIKVPNSTTHLTYMLAETVPEEYRPQMLWQLACTGRQWCDFVSYDPRMPEGLNLFVVRFERDEKAIVEMEHEVERFILEVNELADRLLKHKTGDQVLNEQLRASLAMGPPRAEIPAF